MSWDWLRLEQCAWWRCRVFLFPHYSGWTRFGLFLLPFGLGPCSFSFAVNFGLLTSPLANRVGVATVSNRTLVYTPWIHRHRDSNSHPYPRPTSTWHGPWVPTGPDPHSGPASLGIYSADANARSPTRICGGQATSCTSWCPCLPIQKQG